jgi:hypothetical protein
MISILGTDNLQLLQHGSDFETCFSQFNFYRQYILFMKLKADLLSDILQGLLSRITLTCWTSIQI